MAAATERGFLRQAWDLAWPYWKSEEKGSAIGLLAAVVALNLVIVWLNVRFNYWYNDFYNALQQYEWSRFWWQFAIFGMLALSFIVVGVYSAYLQGILHIRWRRWLTERFLRNWLEDQAYYRMQLNQATTDNPDQRIAEDLNQFRDDKPSTCRLGCFNAFVTLVSFLSILWTLSGALRIPLGGGCRNRYSRLHGVCGADLCRRRHDADAMDRSAVGPAQFRSAALRGGFSLQSGAAARECRERRLLRRRGSRARHLPRPLCPGRRELVGDHQAPQEADLVHLWLRPARGRLPVPRRGPALFRQDDPARRLDADLLGLPPGAGVAVVYRQLVHRDRRIPGGRPAALRVPRQDGRDRRRSGCGPADRDRARRGRRCSRGTRP